LFISFTKIIFRPTPKIVFYFYIKSINYFLFFFLKFLGLTIFPFFFPFLFLFLFFSLFFFFSLFYFFFLTFNTQQGPNREEQPPMVPLAAPHGVPPSLPPPCRRAPASSLSPSPSLPLRRAPMTAFHELKSGHGHLPWRALTNAVCLRGTTKTDAQILPLAIPTLNFMQNEL
jgi:hypothetical protein